MRLHAAGLDANMCSVMVVCVLYPRFELLAALGDRRALLAEPVALAPEAGREQVVGEVVGAGRGVRRGARHAAGGGDVALPGAAAGAARPRGRALALARGARPARGDRRAGRVRPRGGRLLRVRRAARAARGRARRACWRRRAGRSARAPASERRRAASPPRRRAAGAAAARAGTAHVVEEARAARLPRAAARSRCCARAPSCRRCPRSSSGSASARSASWRRCPRARSPSASATRACWRSTWRSGRDTPLEPRRPPEPVVERLDLPEAASGQQLERALELLVARVLARRERRGRSLRALAVSARFVAGGTWRIAVTLRHASADPERILLALGPKLAELPAPAESLGAGGRGVRPARPRPGSAARRGRRGPARAPGRGGPPGAPGGRRRGRAAGARGGPGIAHARAPRGAGAVPRRARVVTGAA